MTAPWQPVGRGATCDGELAIDVEEERPTTSAQRKKSRRFPPTPNRSGDLFTNRCEHAPHVKAHRPVVTLGEDERLDLDDVVSSFSLLVSAIFE